LHNGLQILSFPPNPNQILLSVLVVGFQKTGPLRLSPAQRQREKKRARWGP